MNKNHIFFALLFLSMCIVNAQDYYLQCGQLVDTESGKTLKESTIVVTGNKITSVFNGHKLPDNSSVTIIDLKGKIVLPGLIDMHVHIEDEFGPSSRLNQYILNEADIAYNSVKYCEKTLLSGFTTVRDLGGSGVNIATRNAVNKGKIIGPRIFTAGKSLATTGGHADPTNGSSRTYVGNPGPIDGVVNGVDDAKKAVRQRYKNGADCIKITATGGVLSVAKSGHNPQFTIEEIKAICSTAKDYGMHVAAHAHGDEGMQRAIIGGVNTIEHGTFMSEETMELMKKHDAYLVPTITAGKEVAEKALIDGFYPEIVVPKALEVGPQLQDTFSKAYKKGVNIAFGTDAGVFAHGLGGKEFMYMVEAGMPEIEAIQSATVVNAKVLGLEKELGQIKQGFLADIIAVDENPINNIKTLQKIVFVMKDGVIYKSIQ